MLVRKRLLCVKRLVVHGPAVLNALLAQKDKGGNRTSWTIRVRKDLEILRSQVLPAMLEVEGGRYG